MGVTYDKKKNPKYFTDEDCDNYARLMLKTNALYQNNDPNNPHPKSGIAKQRKELPFASFRESKITLTKGKLFTMKEAVFSQKENAVDSLIIYSRYL